MFSFKLVVQADVYLTAILIGLPILFRFLIGYLTFLVVEMENWRQLASIGRSRQLLLNLLFRYIRLELSTETIYE